MNGQGVILMFHKNLKTSNTQEFETTCRSNPFETTITTKVLKRESGPPSPHGLDQLLR